MDSLKEIAAKAYSETFRITLRTKSLRQAEQELDQLPSGLQFLLLQTLLWGHRKGGWKQTRVLMRMTQLAFNFERLHQFTKTNGTADVIDFLYRLNHAHMVKAKGRLPEHRMNHMSSSAFASMMTQDCPAKAQREHHIDRCFNVIEIFSKVGWVSEAEEILKSIDTVKTFGNKTYELLWHVWDVQLKRCADNYRSGDADELERVESSFQDAPVQLRITALCELSYFWFETSEVFKAERIALSALKALRNMGASMQSLPTTLVIDVMIISSKVFAALGKCRQANTLLDEVKNLTNSRGSMMATQALLDCIECRRDTHCEQEVEEDVSHYRWMGPWNQSFQSSHPLHLRGKLTEDMTAESERVYFELSARDHWADTKEHIGYLSGWARYVKDLGKAGDEDTMRRHDIECQIYFTKALEISRARDRRHGRPSLLTAKVLVQLFHIKTEHELSTTSTSNLMHLLDAIKIYRKILGEESIHILKIHMLIDHFISGRREAVPSAKEDVSAKLISRMEVLQDYINEQNVPFDDKYLIKGWLGLQNAWCSMFENGTISEEELAMLLDGVNSFYRSKHDFFRLATEGIEALLEDQDEDGEGDEEGDEDDESHDEDGESHDEDDESHDEDDESHDEDDESHDEDNKSDENYTENDNSKNNEDDNEHDDDSKDDQETDKVKFHYHDALEVVDHVIRYNEITERRVKKKETRTEDNQNILDRTKKIFEFNYDRFMCPHYDHCLCLQLNKK